MTGLRLTMRKSMRPVRGESLAKVARAAVCRTAVSVMSAPDPLRTLERRRINPQCLRLRPNQSEWNSVAQWGTGCPLSWFPRAIIVGRSASGHTPVSTVASRGNCRRSPTPSAPNVVANYIGWAAHSKCLRRATANNGRRCGRFGRRGSGSSTRPRRRGRRNRFLNVYATLTTLLGGTLNTRYASGAKVCFPTITDAAGSPTRPRPVPACRRAGAAAGSASPSAPPARSGPPCGASRLATL